MRLTKADLLDFLQKLFWLAVLVYIGVTVALAINKNYQSRQKIRSIKQEIADLEAKIKRQELLNIYYNSDTYKELEARRRLSLKKPDEKVFILPKEQDQKAQAPNQPTSQSKKTSVQESNPRRWLRFLMGI